MTKNKTQKIVRFSGMDEVKTYDKIQTESFSDHSSISSLSTQDTVFETKGETEMVRKINAHDKTEDAKRHATLKSDGTKTKVWGMEEEPLSPRTRAELRKLGQEYKNAISK